VLLVEHPRFTDSVTREKLWSGLESYVARFLLLEDKHSDLLKGQTLVEYLWLGGSYVSGRVNPKNIDLTVVVNVEARAQLKGKEGSGWLSDAFKRDSRLAEFGVSPLELPYLRVASVFRSNQLSPVEQDYLRERGSWDDWWQRCRTPGVGKGHPTVDTARAARGYWEVTL
jgi:hypothetical protein